MTKLTKESFLEKYKISEKKFGETTIVWSELTDIYEEYKQTVNHLESIAEMLLSNLMKLSNVHSVRYRIKEPEHVIEKIVRKRIEDPSKIIGKENYKSELTDLIGLRALHLFKDDWINLDREIRSSWNLKQTPEANYRKGDPDELIKKFTENNCEPKEHKFGYRSIHYIIETQPNKEKYYAEIQVRTIFEEAWSEIDHTIRYPYDQHNKIFLNYLMILNRLAGSADEMGTFVQFLKKELNKLQLETDKRNAEYISVIENLKKQVKELKIEKNVSSDIEKNLNFLMGSPKKTETWFSQFNQDNFGYSQDSIENIIKKITNK